MTMFDFLVGTQTYRPDLRDLAQEAALVRQSRNIMVAKSSDYLFSQYLVRQRAENLQSRGVSEKTAWEWAEAEIRQERGIA